MSGSTRKLTAIMFTDIYQYSKLMSVNERSALMLLEEHDRIVTHSFDTYNGQILKSLGDAVFAVFSSSIAAISCALNLQEEFIKFDICL